MIWPYLHLTNREVEIAPRAHRALAPWVSLSLKISLRLVFRVHRAGAKQIKEPITPWDILAGKVGKDRIANIPTRLCGKDVLG